jgi:hypothetical protein
LARLDTLKQVQEWLKEYSTERTVKEFNEKFGLKEEGGK